MKNCLKCLATKVTIWLYNLYTPQKEKNQFFHEMWKEQEVKTDKTPFALSFTDML